MYSMSSLMSVAARSDMLLKIFSCSSSDAVLSASASSSLSTSLSTAWMPLSLTSMMSSKTNISRRICSTRSGSSASSPSMIAFSVARSARFKISATVSMPPAFSIDCAACR
jgi:hypothetical protein